MEKLFVNYLTSIYQNCCTALQSIEDIMPKVGTGPLAKELSNEYTKYDLIAKECEMLGKSEDIDLKDNSWFEKIKLWSAINMSTASNKTDRHIAEMMIQGTVMGLIQCLKDSKDYKAVSKDVDDLCEKLSNLQEENYQNLKLYI